MMKTLKQRKQTSQQASQHFFFFATYISQARSCFSFLFGFSFFFFLSGWESFFLLFTPSHFFSSSHPHHHTHLPQWPTLLKSTRCSTPSSSSTLVLSTPT